MFEATDPEHPAGIINLDGEPDPSFAFGRAAFLRIGSSKTTRASISGPASVSPTTRTGSGNTVVSGGWGMMFQPLDPQNFEAMQSG